MNNCKGCGKQIEDKKGRETRGRARAYCLQCRPVKFPKAHITECVACGSKIEQPHGNRKRCAECSYKYRGLTLQIGNIKTSIKRYKRRVEEKKMKVFDLQEELEKLN